MGAAALNGVEKSPYTGVLKEEEPRTTRTGAVIGGEANGLFQSRRSDAESAPNSLRQSRVNVVGGAHARRSAGEVP